jgi:HD-GYP domain-containing protein (c-di-GMP phosphodiesterase class II)
MKGEDIPLLARIVAVADVYHAIISHRPYRGGASPVQAVQEIKAMTGTQFDPDVVKALVALWHKGALTDLSMVSRQAPEWRSILDLPVALSPPAPGLAGG